MNDFWVPMPVVEDEWIYQKPSLFTDKAKAHWAFQPVSNPTAPTVQNADWCRNDIDRFILAGLEEANLRPNGEADRVSLIRTYSHRYNSHNPYNVLTGFDGGNDADGEEMAGARDDGSGDDNNSRPESNNGDSGNQQGSGGDSAKNSLFIQMQPGATGAFDGEIDGELNLCGYITPVSFTMMFAGLLLMRVGTGRRRF